jgi:hypothetical protein
MPKPKIQISMLSFAETHRWSFGRDLLELLSRMDGRLAPQRAGFYEGGMTPVESIEALRAWWVPPGVEDEQAGPLSRSHDFVWKTSRPRSFCMVHHGLRNMRGELVPASFNFSAEWDRRTDAAGFFEDWAKLARPQLAMLHLFTPPEQIFDPESTVGEWNDFRRGWSLFQSGIFGHALNPVAPYLGWGMIFGRQMLKDVDLGEVERLGIAVEEIGDALYFKLTPDLADVADDFPAFARKRGRFRELLPDDLTLIEREPALVADGAPH